MRRSGLLNAEVLKIGSFFILKIKKGFFEKLLRERRQRVITIGGN